MSRESVLARGRAAAEAGMVDSCVIRRRTGTTTDDNSGDVTPTYDVIYSGKCRMQQGAPAAASTDDGENEVLLVPRVLQLPVATSAGVRAGDRVVDYVSAHDPDLTGREFVVRQEMAKSHATARRLGVEEVTG
jgi:hypothetical protein